MTSERPLVSVIVACRNERRTIPILLRSLAAQQKHNEFGLEVIIADGASTDGTRAALDQFARIHPAVQVIENPGLIASTGLNAAIRASSGSIVVRMDAHTEYAPDYIACCLHIMQRTGAAMVGGPVRSAPGGSYWQQATALAHGSRFFSGGSRVYDLRYDGPVDSVAYGCWPRRALEAAGLFDERTIRNQDDELSLRIRQAGCTIWQSPSIRSWYHPRRSPGALARQFFGYGCWKVYTMRKHRQVVRPRHLVPASTVLAGVVLGIASLLNRVARALLAVASLTYAAAVCAASLKVACGRRERRLLPGILAVFPVAHISYGAGTLVGLCARRKPT